MVGLEELVEGVSLERLYYGATKYMRVQSPNVKQMRVEAGELMIRNIEYLKALVWWGLKAVEVNGKVRSEKGKEVYSVRVMFLDVEISEEWSEYTPIKLMDGKTGEIFYTQFMTPDVEVAVLCTCMDFACRWAWVLKKEGGLLGKPRDCKRKLDVGGKPRKSQNVAGVQTVCKHLFAVFEWLAKKGMIADKLRAGVEIDLTDLNK